MSNVDVLQWPPLRPLHNQPPHSSGQYLLNRDVLNETGCQLAALLKGRTRVGNKSADTGWSGGVSIYSELSD